MIAFAQSPREWIVRHGEAVFLTLLIAGHVALIWLHPWFVSQDGPSHLENANILRRYADSDNAFRHYYVINDTLSPNWLTTVILLAWMLVFPPLLAEKILLSMYVVGFPLAVRFALGALRTDSKPLAVLSLPLVYNFCLHMGMYNYCLGLAGFFVVFGYWVRANQQWTAGNIAFLGLLSVLLYFCHLIPLVMAWIAISIMSVWLVLRRQALPSESGWRRLRTSAFASALAVLPSLILTVVFLRRSGISSPATPPPVRPIRQIDFLFLLSFDWAEAWICSAVFLLFVALIIRVITNRRPQPLPWDGLVIGMLAFLLIYALAPDVMAGGGYLKSRLSFFPFFMVLLWVGAHSFSRRDRWLVHAAVGVIAAIQLGWYASCYRSYEREIREFLSTANQIERGSTILPLVFTSRGMDDDGTPLSIRVEPFLHLAGTLAAERDLVNLRNYETKGNHFQVLFRDAVNPYLHLTQLETGFEKAAPIDLLEYSRETPGEIDYVLFWGLQPSQAKAPSVQSLIRQVDAGYTRIEVSSSTSQVQVYRRKDKVQPSSGTAPLTQSGSTPEP